MSSKEIERLSNEFVGEDICQKLIWVTAKLTGTIPEKVSKPQVKAVHYTMKFILKQDIPNWKHIKGKIQ